MDDRFSSGVLYLQIVLRVCLKLFGGLVLAEKQLLCLGSTAAVNLLIFLINDVYL
jgi:hypothetical protein